MPHLISDIIIFLVLNMGTCHNQCVLFVILNLVFFINCFNLDIVNYVKQSGPRNSMFGFSVATHEDRGQTW